MAEQQVAIGHRPFVALSAATATGASGGVDLTWCASNASIILTVTGAPTAVSVNLEGSLDGTNWVVLKTLTAAGVGSSTGVPVRFIRANLTTLTGGTTPTVTALLGAGG